jgi:SPP1 family predicted phage head-tail adaptor
MGRAGQLDRRIRIDRANIVQDEMGGMANGGFTPLTTIWARRTDLSAAESFKADEKSSTRITIFKVRSSKLIRDVTPKDKIYYNGHDYEITGIKETKEGRNNYLEFTTIVRNDVKYT